MGYGRDNELTDDAFQARVSRNGLSVVTFPSFETLGKVHHRLDVLPLEIKLVNAALRYHLTRQGVFSRAERGWMK